MKIYRTIMKNQGILKNVLVLFFILCYGSISYAQHDAHRDAVREIARGEYGSAEGRITKVIEDPSSLWRGLTKAYERAGMTVKSEGEEYRRFIIPENYFVMSMLASMKGELKESFEYAKAAVKEGLPFERLVAGPRAAFDNLYNTEYFQEWSKKESRALIHGPMLGNITADGASFWVRTAHETLIEIQVWPKGQSFIKNKKYAKSQTLAVKDFTTVIRIDSLRPNTNYEYKLFVDGKMMPVENTSFKTYPEKGNPGKFSIAFGGGAGYVPEHERVWTTIKDHNPLALLMLGDNVYIDDPEHSLTQQYCYYRRQSRPEWRDLVAGRGVYSIWDDHDFGVDDSYGGPEIETPVWKRAVWEVFTQNWNNPSYGGGARQPGCWYDFYIGDVHFIMLDCRYYRESSGRHDPRVDNPSMLGPVQLEWLKSTLKNSQGTFKVLVSSVPMSPGTKGEGVGGLDTWDGYTEERDQIHDFLYENNISGVIVLSADRHRSDVRLVPRENGYDLYEFMSSVLTNYHTHPVVETPELIFGYNKKNTFGLVHFNTEIKDPKLTFEIVTIDDESIWSMDLKLSQLKSER